MSDDSLRDDVDGGANEELDELVEPSVDLRTAQEREQTATSDGTSEDASGEVTPDCRDGLEPDSQDEVGELVEPSVELQTVQEQEQEVAGEDAGGGGDE